MREGQKTGLSGKRVLVTRARTQASATVELLRARGAEPVVIPTIEIHPPPDPAALEAALGKLTTGAYDWVLFTSANGVDAAWSALVARSEDARAFGRTRIGAVGTATAKALEKRGLVADLVAKEFRGEGLAEALIAAPAPAPAAAPASAPTRALLLRAAKARDALPDALRAAGWQLDIVAAYETRGPPADVAVSLARELAARRIDAVLFTSSSTVDNLCDLLGPAAESLLGGLRVASIGPVTTATAVARGVRVDVTASPYTLEGLIEALERTWA